MTHLLILSLIAGLQSIAAPAAIGRSAPTLNVAVRRVELTVSVTDRKTHQPVRNLNISDFRILDNGHPTGVTHFDPPGHTRPFMVWLLLRNDYVDQKILKKIETEMPAALKVLPDSALVGVASYSELDSVLWLSPQPDRTAALAAVHQLVLANPDASLQKPSKKSNTAPAPTAASGIRQAAAPAPTPDDREAIKHPYVQIFTDVGPSGGINMVEKDWVKRRNSGFLPVVVILSDEFSYDFVWSAERAKNHLLRNGITLDELEEAHSGLTRWMVAYTKVIAPTGISLDPTDMMHRYRYETYLANSTGGEVAAVKEHDYRAGFEKIFRDLNSVYALEFAPAKIDGKWHNISVQLLPRAGLRRGQYKVRVRRRYFAEKSDSAAPAQSAPGR